jgi:hypothetical protein
LVELSASWPESSRSEVLTLTLALENPEYLTSALAGLIPYLQRTALLDALFVITQLPEHDWIGVNRRTEILIQICPLLVQCNEIDRTLLILQGFTEDKSIARVLTNIYPILPEPSQKTALAFTQNIKDPLMRASTLIALMPKVTDSQIEIFINYLDNIGDEKLRIQGLIGLAPWITPDQIQKFLGTIINIDDKQLRAQALAALVSNWLLLPVPQSLSLWRECIQISSRRHRPDLLSDLSSLSPVISDLGGITAIKDILKTIKVVTKWWS